MRHAIVDVRIRFLAAVACWSAALLVILRSPLGERIIVAPFAAWHAVMAYGVSGGSPVVVDLSCSGSDVIALSMAAILAYPVSWGRRLSGLGMAIVWLAGLNLVRIITLVNTAGSPVFLPLHLYIWPAIMIGGAAAFVFYWIWTGDRTIAADTADRLRARRLVATAGLLVVGYAAFSPWLLRSDALQRLATVLAGVAAASLRVAGVAALSGGSTFVVADQPFVITPECVITPLMPVYLAWALVWPRRLGPRLAAIAALVPLFVSLSILRLLTVALPAMIGPPLFLTHGFYQLVIGVLLIAAAVYWRATVGDSATPLQQVTGAALIAVAAALALAKPYTWLIDAGAQAVRTLAPHTLSALPSAADVQGAVAIMPAYQLALLCGLTAALFGRQAWRPLLVLLPAATVLQIATLVAAGEMSTYAGTAIPPMMIRVVSIVTPAALVLLASARDRRTAVGLRARVRPTA